MSEPEPRPTDLRPGDFEAPPDDPFANDRLNRKESVESLCTIIQNAQQPLVVSVEGAYGLVCELAPGVSDLRLCSPQKLPELRLHI